MYKNKEDQRKAVEKWRNENRERYNEISRKASILWRNKNRKRYNENRVSNNRLLKVEVLSAYGVKGQARCYCCGEKEIDFLCLDHINNDGRKHRKEVKQASQGNGFYRYLKRNKYPKRPKLQTSCYNCNNSRKISKICAHTIKKYGKRTEKNGVVG